MRFDGLRLDVTCFCTGRGIIIPIEIHILVEKAIEIRTRLPALAYNSIMHPVHVLKLASHDNSPVIRVCTMGVEQTHLPEESLVRCYLSRWKGVWDCKRS